MNSNGFNVAPNKVLGAAIIFKKIDQKDIDDYKNKIKSMSIEEFTKFTGSDTLQKSYEAYKVGIRKEYIGKYFKEWVYTLYLGNMTDGVNSNQLLRGTYVNWLLGQINNIDKKEMLDARARQESIRSTMNTVQPSKNKLICTTFTINKLGVTHLTNYAYLYSRVEDASGIENFKHLYFCTGPNLISADGEYRSGFTHISSLEHTMYAFSDIWDDIEEYLHNRTNVKFEQNYYYTTTDTEKVNQLKKNIAAHKFVMHFYIIAWLNQGLLLYLNMQNIEKYNKNMFDKEDIKFIHELLKTYTLDNIKSMCNASKHVNIKTDTPGNFSMICGQKMIPVSNEEASNPMNIEYDVWKELYISELISDLIINMICPGVSYTHDWFIVYGIDKWIFNNKNMYNKMEISDNVKRNISKVKKASANSYYGFDSKKESSNQLAKKYNYDDEIIFVSDYGIVIISEYVGNTINDISTLMKSEHYRKTIGSIFSHTDIFSKYMFDITYTLLCLNEKCNVIHGDLHLNNTTIRRFASTDAGQSKFLYVINDIIFAYPNYNQTGTIIDYSRSFIIPRGKFVGDSAKLKNKQINRIYTYYVTLFPDFTKKYGTTLKNKLNSDFQKVFKVFSAIDLYIHTDRLYKFIRSNPHLNAHKKSVELVRKINTMSAFYLKDVMAKIISTNRSINSIKYPNYDILLKCFNEHILTPPMLKKKIKINNIFFFNNNLKYSFDRFDTLPPRLKCLRLKKMGFPSIVDIPVAIPSLIQLKTYYERKKSEVRLFIS